MALTATEEAQARQLIAQQAALLSLAGNEATITSKLGAAKVNLGQLPAASALADADLLLVRQGTTDKSVAGSIIKALANQPDASETVKGIIEIATAAEAQAFTANKAIDGAKLAAAMQGANQSLAASGYQKLPSGLIIQWGTIAGSASTDTAVTFPIAFPTACLSATHAVQASTPGVSAQTTVPATTTGFSFAAYNNSTVRQSSGIQWFAVGY